MSSNHLGLYIHIPFCVKKCNYCDFVSLYGNLELQLKYFHALINELTKQSELISDRVVNSIYIGGGTPSILKPELIYELSEKITNLYNLSEDVEFSIEINPGTANESFIEVLQKTKINRVSIGVQSFNNHELELLGRIHNKDEAISTINILNPLFNLNIDLMFGIPGQSLSSWQNTVQQAIELKPDHISSYSLIVEERTALAGMINQGKILLPDDSDEDEMYINAVKYLSAAGYGQYEISNFALENKACRHNIGYWKGEDSLGIGTSAVSYLNKLRFKNTDNIFDYISIMESHISPVNYAERNCSKNGMLEEVMLGLRMSDGFNIVALEKKWGCNISDVSGIYNKLLADGILVIINENLKLSKENFRFANKVIVDLMNDL